MKKIEAITRHEVLEPLRDALDKAGFHGMSVSEVRGAGSQRGYTETYRGVRASIVFRPKIKVEMIINEENVDQLVSLICEHAYTGEVGDGKIFIYPIEDVVRIRTQQRGRDAL